MDYGALPPEINSGRMYAGPGSAPLLSAAAAWDGLAAEFDSAAVAYGSLVARLTGGQWTGPASTAMAAAASPYVAWLSAIAEQAGGAAAQARAAALAYEAAHAMTVPPPVVATNRSELISLVATNILGQNTPAIAAVEAQYAEMWAQDATAMYGYAGASTAASTVTPFTEPPRTSDPAAGSRLAATMPRALQQLSSTPSSAPSATWNDLKTYLPQIQKAAATTEQIVQRLVSTPANIAGILKSLTPAASTAGAAASASAAPGFAGFGGLGGGGTASAITGKAGSIGRLSVPPSWATGAPPANAGAAALETGAVSAAPDEPRGLLRGVPLSGAGRRTGGFVNRYGFRHTVMPRPPAAG